MTTRNLTKITKKYTPTEIKTAVRVLLDILATQNGSEFETVDPKEEFTEGQIKRLQKQLAEHKKGAAKYLNLNQVKDALGV